MKISKTSKTSTCHSTQSTQADDKFGCFEDCTGKTGSITGDYLLIPGGLYEIPTASGSAQGKLYKNDYYCGEGLANKDGMVRVDMPGPVTVRSGHISFTRIESHY